MSSSKLNLVLCLKVFLFPFSSFTAKVVYREAWDDLNRVGVSDYKNQGKHQDEHTHKRKGRQNPELKKTNLMVFFSTSEENPFL